MNKIFKFLMPVLVTCFSLDIYAQTVFTGKPQYQILTKRGGTYLGTFTVELFPNIAPKHVRNFDSLVSTHFYDTTAFHRCIPGFMIQGGDPNSRSGPVSTWGYGQPGQPQVQAEFSVAKHVRGILSAARKPNPLINSATSQFFICVATASNLDGQYSIYGRVIKGMNWVDTIVLTPKTAPPPSTYSNMPLQKIEMFVTYLGSNDTVPPAPTLINPPNNSVGIDTSFALQLSWAPVSSGIIYHFDLSKDSLFLNDTIASLDTPNLSKTQTNLKGNTRYYWKVRVNNGGHFSPWSPVWTFHTKGETTSIDEANTEQNRIRIFPNPGRNLFSFENITKGSKVDIVDAKGSLILSKYCSQSSLQIDLSGYSKGVYSVLVSDPAGIINRSKLVIQ